MVSHWLPSFLQYNMSELFPQQMKAATDILTVFSDTVYRFVLLFALMQSGKTDTFLFVACEMLHLEKVARVVLYTGNREKTLIEQLRKDVNDFRTIYAKHLQTHYGKSEREAVKDAAYYLNSENFIILGGQDLANPKLFTPNGNPTLYIWEESHYGSSESQEVDEFQERIGINSTGENLGNNFMISVSATPFAELAKIRDLNQPKAVVQLIPDDKYLSPEKLKTSGRLLKTTNVEQTLRDVLPTITQNGYVLIRASEKKQDQLRPIIESHLGWSTKKFDQSTKRDDDGKRDINTILDEIPSSKIVVFINGMCRMGKRIHKQHILFGMETSSSKTDTLLQGLVGRWCGYAENFVAPIYVFKLDEADVQDTIDQWNGVAMHGPKRAMNIKGGKKPSPFVPIIPIRIKYDGADSDYEPADAILRAIGTEKFENHNDPRHATTIHDTIRTICEARRVPATGRNPDQQSLAGKCKVLNLYQGGRKDFVEELAKIRAAFLAKKPERFGSGLGLVSKSGGEIVIAKSETEIFVYMFVENDTPDFVRLTTGKEIFGKKPDGHEAAAFFAVGAAMAAE
jgi:hypothetical protein